MAVIAHLQNLQEKHFRLEEAVTTELARPLPDFGLVTAFKKQKLLIKEEISRLQSQMPEEAVAA